MNSKPQKRLTLGAMCLATFVAILDSTVVNLAPRAIQADLGASLAALLTQAMLPQVPAIRLRNAASASCGGGGGGNGCIDCAYRAARNL